MTRGSGHALATGEQSSSHSSGYSEYYDTDSDDDLYADMDDAAVAARQFDDAHRDIAHFFKHHPTLGQAQAMLRAAGVHKIAQLKGLDVPVMVQRGVCERDAEVIHAALHSENPTDVFSAVAAGSAVAAMVEEAGVVSGEAGSATLLSQALPTASGAPSEAESVSSSDPLEDAMELCCPVCLGIMVEPVTLICGHSTCKRCCTLAFELSPKCPAGCGRVMPRCLPEVNVSLRNAVQRRFGKQYAARAKEVEQREREHPSKKVPSYFSDEKVVVDGGFGLTEAYLAGATVLCVLLLEVYLQLGEWTLRGDRRAAIFSTISLPQFWSDSPAAYLGMSLLANQDGLDALAPHVNWHASLLHAVFPIPNTLFRLYKAFPEYPMFCIVSIVTVALGLAVVVQRAHVLLKTRLMLQHSLCAAWTDVAYVLTIASVINSLLGTVLLPLMFVLHQEVHVVPMAAEVIYFALAAPLFTAALYAIATIHPVSQPRERHVARAVFASQR